jgi:hypothetical protein
MGMPRRSSPIVVPFVLWIALGIFFPVGVLIALLASHESPYVLDRTALATARTALGGHPVSVRAASGVLDVIADRAETAVYADGSSATIAQTDTPGQVIEKYCSSMHERTSTSSSVGGFTQRDATLSDGRVARTFGVGKIVLSFVAPSAAALDRLVAQSALRRNPAKGIGNKILDGHVAIAILIGAGWFALVTVFSMRAMMRALNPRGPTPPAPWYQSTRPDPNAPKA